MFGKPIYDHSVGNWDSIRPLMEKKYSGIQGYKSRVYFESSHAFLKSYYDLAPEYFADLRTVHLIRNPLFVASSEATREQLIHRIRLPFRYYKGDDGANYFRWALTGRERIFQDLNLAWPTRFQRYVTQWIEIENRAMGFREQLNREKQCYTLHSPFELNDPGQIRDMLQFLELEPTGQSIRMTGSQNRTPGISIRADEKHWRELRDVVEALPRKYLSIFSKPPYTKFDWHDWLIP